MAEAAFDGSSSFLGLRGHTVELPTYQGPLDLLLKLIRKNELDIYDIPIALVTEQYLAELQAIQQHDPGAAGDFLLMAATLLEIKTAMLLPSPPRPENTEDDRDPRAALVAQLLEYQAFRDVAARLGELEAVQRRRFGHPFAAAALAGYAPVPPAAPNLSPESLAKAFSKMLQRLSESEAPVTALKREAVPLRLRMAELIGILGDAGKVGIPLDQLLQRDRGRLYVVISFLAVLELIRIGRVCGSPEGRDGYRFWIVPAAGSETSPGAVSA